jgi:hypothetical protein
MFAPRRWFLVAAFLLLAGTVLSGALWLYSAASDAAQPEILLNAPTEVLDGTDLVELNDLRPAELPSPLEGTYQAEQGGAMATVSITLQTDDRWIVMRTYEEPELEAEVKEYVAERDGAALVGIDGDLAIQGTEEGLLVLELSSGSESIPAAYWVHYIRLQ